LILREIPTRNSLQESLDAIINPLDDDDDDRNPTKPLMLHPITLEGTAAQLPYQVELVAITAAIKCMKKHDEETSQKTTHPMHLTTATQSALAAISAAIAQLENKRPTVQPPLDNLCIPDIASMINSAMAESLPAAVDDDVPCLPTTTSTTSTNDSAMADLSPADNDDILHLHSSESTQLFKQLTT